MILLREGPSSNLDVPAHTAETQRNEMMDENRLTGTAREVAGKVEGVFGSLTGDHGREAQGRAREVAGKAEGETLDRASSLVKDDPVKALAITAGVAFLMGMFVARR